MRREQDPAWLDGQYNNRARIADHADIFASWARASAYARQHSPGAQLDLPYGDGAGETLDLFPAVCPARGAGAPVLVFIHGGWWRSLDKADHSFVAPSLAADGALVVVPNYALAPSVGIEHITLQMVKALEWVWRHAAAYGGDPSRIVVAGHSAGAHLAAMLLSCRWRDVADDLPAQLVGGALAISGVYDLEPLRLTTFLQPDLGLTPASVKRLSPAFFPRPKGRLLAVVGGDESEAFLRQNQLIRDVWGPTAVPVCEQLPGLHHLAVLKSLADPGGRLHALACSLLGLAPVAPQPRLSVA
ncbi:MAG TPA: alpha/beta hydrolase [Rubrivivax sp.]|jgi:arylformamidase|nr:alpha/beta hydrolase [Rubrivivax sp.]